MEEPQFADLGLRSDEMPLTQEHQSQGSLQVHCGREALDSQRLTRTVLSRVPRSR